MEFFSSSASAHSIYQHPTPMAHLASIHGTEKDKRNCSFFFKMGACRHGDRCNKYHHKPISSPTILLKHFYENPASKVDPHSGEPLIKHLTQEDLQNHFEEFYEEIFTELSLHAEIIEMNVCENLSPQLIGNVYVMFASEEGAVACQRAIHGRFYAGRPIHAEFSPVVNFRDSRCQQYEKQVCTRGAFCNFMHLRLPSKRLMLDLYDEMYERLDLQEPFLEIHRPKLVDENRSAWLDEGGSGHDYSLNEAAYRYPSDRRGRGGDRGFRNDWDRDRRPSPRGGFRPRGGHQNRGGYRDSRDFNRNRDDRRGDQGRGRGGGRDRDSHNDRGGFRADRRDHDQGRFQQQNQDQGHSHSNSRHSSNFHGSHRDNRPPPRNSRSNYQYD